uniref:DUF4168 domain-containing protein n=2 Tax=Panagrellus redivivus TaxID=6233 RepID=A0A7E4UZ00_PANRE
MPKLCETDDVSTSQPSACQFCLCDTPKLYCCPKCKAFYCSLRCYKAKKHSSCSEKFYQEQISQTVVEPQVKQPPPDPRLKEATSFEDYMKRMKEDDKEKTEEDKNPQIEVNSDEEVLFDSDEEPEYLSKVMDKAVEDYEKADIEDINIRLMKAGVASLVDDEDEQMDKLYNLLNDEEKKTFTRLAEQMHYDEVGISQSCFKKRENE